MALEEYNRKRHFSKTSEPTGKLPAAKKGAARGKRAKPLSFVVQKHAATRLHYDFRLELDGVLKSWAVPKGPSLDPHEKRLAVEVEDHPLEYAKFEGVIPAGEYGGGEVIVWDRGTWTPLNDPHTGLEKGKLEFELAGEKLSGAWTLIRLRRSQGGKPNWLLLKRTDQAARSGAEGDITEQQPQSVKTGRNVEDLAPDVAKKRVVKKPVLKKGAAKKRAPKKVATKKSARKYTPTAPRVSRAKSSLRQAGAGNAKSRSNSNRIAALPNDIEAQLATLTDKAPEGPQWIHEMKLDGYRMLAQLHTGKARLITRNGQDWTHKYPSIAQELAKLPVDSAVIDGELVALLSNGVSSFQALQNAASDGEPAQLAYFMFDLLFLNGDDLRGRPLLERKTVLEKLLAKNKSPQLQYSEHIKNAGPAFFQQSCQMGLEGIISKRADRPYRSGRSEEWLKTKCIGREELVIGGYTVSTAAARGIGAILVGYFAGDELVYAGRVGTGFNNQLLQELRAKFQNVQQEACPFRSVPAKERGPSVRWIRPQYVAQIEFSGWTDAGVLRHPSFQGLREDKPARSVTRPQSLTAPPASAKDLPRGRTSRTSKPTKRSTGNSSNASRKPLPVELTHPDRVLFVENGLTKLGLATYYDAVAEWMLPHLAGRPLSLVRCPQGRSGGKCFFQKHATDSVPQPLDRVEIQEKDETETYLMANRLEALLSLVQMSVLEIHTWGSRSDRLEQPDRLVFDLDPDEGVPWQRVVQATFRVRELLQDYGLQSFLKTTGGKGLHVVVPINPRRLEWEAVKSFTRSVAEQLASDAPNEFVSSMSKAARKGKIFIDYLRNDRGATAVAPYSTRARTGATVSMPLAWEELTPNLRSDHFRVDNALARLRSLRKDPWAQIGAIKQSIPTTAKAR
jgi:bifunctional non-homologous end joining protein LigD